MGYEIRRDKWWFGALLAVLLAPSLLFLCDRLVGMFAAVSGKQELTSGPLSAFLVVSLLILVSRHLMVGRSMEKAGRAFLAVVLPAALVYLYYHFRIQHGR